MDDLQERMSKFEDDFLKFEEVKNPVSKRSDLHAFVMLDRWFPGESDIVVHAEHDEIWLDITDEQANTLTDDQLQELVRCGVRHDGSGLCMFV